MTIKALVVYEAMEPKTGRVAEAVATWLLRTPVTKVTDAPDADLSDGPAGPQASVRR